jgi:hypothetical protein
VSARARFVIAVAALAAILSVAATANAAPALKTATKCTTVKLKLVRRGKVVKRHGRVVYKRVRKCKTVPSASCKVTWSKQRKRGRVVIRKHNPVYVAKVSCPTPSTGAGAPAPAPAGPGNAAVAVYAVDVQGYTFQDQDLNGALPAQSIVPIENVTQHGYLVRLITPVPGLNGPADNEIGLFLGSLVDLGPHAGTLQWATNTLMFSAANPSDPSLYNRLPFPYDLGQVAQQGQQLVGLTTYQTVEGAIPVGGQSPDYFVDRTGLIAGTIKNASDGAVSVTFAPGDASLNGVFEVQGAAPFTTPGLIPPSEYGRFGLRGTITGTRITAPAGAPIYLPPPLPNTPRPPGCRTELHLVPGINDGTLTEQLLSVCR